MSAHLTIALTIAFAMIVNARIVVARSASMLPSEMLKNMESERLPNKMTYDEYQRYMEGWPYAREIEQAPPGYVHIFEKPSHEEISNNSLDEQLKAVEEYPEPLPVPQAQLSNDDLKGPLYKKSGSHYHMTICHFKICNMGRKRDTHNQKY